MEAEALESPSCKNCGTPLTGEYCPKCGQRDYDFNRSFREIAAELAESFWNWDTKLFRGVYDLLFRPGQLTAEYLAGKRASQVPPLRFYLFVSILFFLTASFDPRDELIDVNPANADAALDGVVVDPFTRKKIQDSVDAAKQRSNEFTPTERRAMEFLNDKFERRREIVRMIGEHIPKLIFACLPFFALITRVVFRRAKFGFLSHLVLALHLHSFYFLFSVVSDGWVMLADFIWGFLAGLGGFASVIYPFVYVYKAARRVFGGTPSGTFWRCVLAAVLYLVTLGLGFVIFLIIVFLMA